MGDCDVPARFGSTNQQFSTVNAHHSQQYSQETQNCTSEVVSDVLDENLVTVALKCVLLKGSF